MKGMILYVYAVGYFITFAIGGRLKLSVHISSETTDNAASRRGFCDENFQYIGQMNEINLLNMNPDNTVKNCSCLLSPTHGDWKTNNVSFAVIKNFRTIIALMTENITSPEIAISYLAKIDGSASMLFSYFSNKPAVSLSVDDSKSLIVNLTSNDAEFQLLCGNTMLTHTPLLSEPTSTAVTVDANGDSSTKNSFMNTNQTSNVHNVDNSSQNIWIIILVIALIVCALTLFIIGIICIVRRKCKPNAKPNTNHNGLQGNAVSQEAAPNDEGPVEYAEINMNLLAPRPAQDNAQVVEEEVENAPALMYADIAFNEDLNQNGGSGTNEADGGGLPEDDIAAMYAKPMKRNKKSELSADV